MNKDYYNSFLDAAEKSIKENKGAQLFKTRDDIGSLFVDRDETTWRFRTMLQHTIENLDEELNRFEKHFTNKNFNSPPKFTTS